MKNQKSRLISNISVGSIVLFFLGGILLFSCNQKLPPENNEETKEVQLQKASIETLSLRWTFGNHEPISMYRRAGNKVTGGMEGSALWLEDWHHWYDSEECTGIMEELGLNILHSRFYKGMGWNFESKDFPRVKEFVNNCHKHGIKVLAYTQFMTLYYETMLEEIPNLGDWVALDENGQKRTWHNSYYYRWVPCVNSPEFESYLKKVVKIALEEGDFDGIMYDNCDVPECYCPRCTKLFREYLSKETNPEERFGISNVNHVLPPVRKSAYGEIQDPLYQEWVKFRCENVKALFQRMYSFAKECKPDAIISGNVANIRRSNKSAAEGLNIVGMDNCFDLFVSQSGNAPGVESGYIINRVREFKLGNALKVPVLALCDDDAKASEEKYVLTLMEDAVFGGIPTDRTIMKPDRDMLSRELIDFRRPILYRFDQTIDSEHESFAAEDYEPIKILYSNASIKFSEKSYRAILGAEEVFLRNHIPYGLLVSSDSYPLEIPEHSEVLVVCNQNCLSDNEINTIIRFANNGGRVIITGESGWHDELYRQRRDNPLIDKLKGIDNVSWLADTEFAPVKSGGWKIQVGKPGKPGQQLMESLEKFWSPKFRINAPETVFVNIKKSGETTFYIHLLNYAHECVMKDIQISGKEDISEAGIALPMENKPMEIIPFYLDSRGLNSLKLPGFDKYALVKLKTTVK